MTPQPAAAPVPKATTVSPPVAVARLFADLGVQAPSTPPEARPGRSWGPRVFVAGALAGTDIDHMQMTGYVAGLSIQREAPVLDLLHLEFGVQQASYRGEDPFWALETPGFPSPPQTSVDFLQATILIAKDFGPVEIGLGGGVGGAYA